VFAPQGGSAKFERYHAALRERGVTRLCPEVFSEIPAWDYAPLDSARVIADEIERRWARRAHMLSGMAGA
jgi:mitochondrial fission protein ELM1